VIASGHVNTNDAHIVLKRLAAAKPHQVRKERVGEILRRKVARAHDRFDEAVFVEEPVLLRRRPSAGSGPWP